VSGSNGGYDDDNDEQANDVDKIGKEKKDETEHLSRRDKHQYRADRKPYQKQRAYDGRNLGTQR